MQDTRTAGDLEVVVTEQTGPRCERPHPDCTVTAVAIAQSCTPPQFVCADLVAKFERCQVEGGTCSRCGQPVSHWTLVLLP